MVQTLDGYTMGVAAFAAIGTFLFVGELTPGYKKILIGCNRVSTPVS